MPAINPCPKTVSGLPDTTVADPGAAPTRVGYVHSPVNLTFPANVPAPTGAPPVLNVTATDVSRPSHLSVLPGVSSGSVQLNDGHFGGIKTVGVRIIRPSNRYLDWLAVGELGGVQGQGPVPPGVVGDVWLEGPGVKGDGSLEPGGHISLSVGNPDGSYWSFSYGADYEDMWTDEWGLTGIVYRDVSSPGEIDSENYYKTSPETDARIIARLRTILDRRGNYNLNVNCRYWSWWQFTMITDELEFHDLGHKANPPPTPNRDMNVQIAEAKAKDTNNLLTYSTYSTESSSGPTTYNTPGEPVHLGEYQELGSHTLVDTVQLQSQQPQQPEQPQPCQWPPPPCYGPTTTGGLEPPRVPRRLPFVPNQRGVVWW